MWKQARVSLFGFIIMAFFFFVSKNKQTNKQTVLSMLLQKTILSWGTFGSCLFSPLPLSFSTLWVLREKGLRTQLPSTWAGQLWSSKPPRARMSLLPPCLVAKLTPVTRKERKTGLVCFLLQSESPPRTPWQPFQPTRIAGVAVPLRASSFASSDTAQW